MSVHSHPPLTSALDGRHYNNNNFVTYSILRQTSVGTTCETAMMVEYHDLHVLVHAQYIV